jgi:transposase
MPEGLTIEALYKEFQLLNLRVHQLEEENKKIPLLEAEIRTLKSENAQLRKRLSKYEAPKNSNNSSIPPSKDENRPKRKSLREKSGRKPGGQKGHKGTTLQMVDNPDKIEVLVSDYCNSCGNDLRSINVQFESKRQVVDLPEIRPIYTEFRCFSRHCTCGHKQIADYPDHVTNHIQYGASVEAAVAYYSVYQYLPFRRMSDLFTHVYNLPISEGTIGNMLERLGKKGQPIYDIIRRAIAWSKIAVGGDETGARVNGEKFWAWIWQTVKLTYITVSESRGKIVIDQLFPGGFENAVLVSDRWRSHINTYAKGHQLCIPHLLREINYLIELEKTEWAESIKTLFKQALELKRKIPEYHRDNPDAQKIETSMDDLLNKVLLKAKTPKTQTFQNSMRDYRDYLFTFLYNKDVPPDNNGSERGIRNFKVKLKVSGQFKTGQNTFAKIRSIIDTAKKNDIPVLHALKLVAQMPILAAE